jgi:hypothetical protein
MRKNRRIAIVFLALPGKERRKNGGREKDGETCKEEEKVLCNTQMKTKQKFQELIHKFMSR